MLQQSSLDDLELDVLDVERLLGLASRRLLKGKLLLLLNDLNQVLALPAIYSTRPPIRERRSAGLWGLWCGMCFPRPAPGGRHPVRRQMQDRNTRIRLGLRCHLRGTSSDSLPLSSYVQNYGCLRMSVAGPWHGRGHSAE